MQAIYAAFFAADSRSIPTVDRCTIYILLHNVH